MAGIVDAAFLHIPQKSNHLTDVNDVNDGHHHQQQQQEEEETVNLESSLIQWRLRRLQRLQHQTPSIEFNY